MAMIEKVLILAPHTDDGELACGATISRMLRHGVEIYYVAFSSCEDSLPQGFARGALVKELYRATSSLGIKRENVRVLDFRVRYFGDHRQDILESMVALAREIDPDVVFSPSIHDIHQDHVPVATECLRAFKKKTILQYEVPWNNYTFDNQMFVVVDETDVENKIKAVACYDSQSGRNYTSPEFIRSVLLTHGVQIGAKYAEVFEVPRLILKEGEMG